MNEAEADIWRRSAERRQREQDEADAEAAAEVSAQAETEEARGGFNRLIRGDVDAPPEAEQLEPSGPTRPTGSADGVEGTDGTENHVYEWVQTDSGVERMRVFDLDDLWNDNYEERCRPRPSQHPLRVADR